jgi:hypothetical protein
MVMLSRTRNDRVSKKSKAKELGKKITYLEFHKIKISQVMGQLGFASFFQLMKRNI